jgi:hypothetical protein
MDGHTWYAQLNMGGRLKPQHNHMFVVHLRCQPTAAMCRPKALTKAAESAEHQQQCLHRYTITKIQASTLSCWGGACDCRSGQHRFQWVHARARALLTPHATCSCCSCCIVATCTRAWSLLKWCLIRSNNITSTGFQCMWCGAPTLGLLHAHPPATSELPASAC